MAPASPKNAPRRKAKPTKKASRRVSGSKGSLKAALTEARAKLGVKKDAELGKFLPGPHKGFRLHHLALSAMVREEPARLEALVLEHILNAKKPQQRPLHRPKKQKRRARSSGYERVRFTPAERKMLLKHARATRDKRRVRQLLRDQLPALQDQLCRSVNRGHINQDLWARFVEATTGSQPK